MYTNGGRLIVAGLIFTFFSIIGGYIAGTAVANAYNSKAGKYNTLGSLKDEVITAPLQYVSFLQTVLADNESIIKAQAETSAVRIIDNVIDEREPATFITLDMMLSAGLTKPSGEDQLKDIFIIDEVFGQLEYPVYIRSTSVTVASERLNLESALLKLQTTGRAQAIVKRAGYNYVWNDTRKYYAGSALTLFDFQSAFLFVVVTLCL